MLIIACLAAHAYAQEQSKHPCDVIERNVAAGQQWNPLVNAPVSLFFCGPNVGESARYRVEIDGKPVQTTGLLALDHLEANASPFWQTAGVNGLVPYVGAPIVLTTPGKHTIRVTYGPGQTVVSFEWLASTCAEPKWPGDAPLGVATINCR